MFLNALARHFPRHPHGAHALFNSYRRCVLAGSGGTWGRANIGSQGGNWPWPVVRLLCSDTKVLNRIMSTVQSNGILGIIRNPEFVYGNVVGILSKHLPSNSPHSSAEYTLPVVGKTSGARRCQ